MAMGRAVSVLVVLAVSLAIASAAPPETSAPVSPSTSSAKTSPPGITTTAPHGPGSPVLHGIILGERHWIAYIVDPTTHTVSAYRVGDTVAGRTIETIEGRRVVLKGPEGRMEIRLTYERPGTATHSR